MSKTRLNIDALIFSIDDVLVDVSATYREVVRQTVQLYLEQAIGLSASKDKEPLLTADEVTLLQKVGRFSSYWDLAAAFIMYFVERLPPAPVPTFPSKLHVPNIIAYLQLSGGRLQISLDQLRRQKDIARLARDIANAGGGLDGADMAVTKTNRHLLVEGGDIIKSNLVGRIFQELYLGADLFERIYQQPPVLAQSTGYIEHEALLINPQVLAYLKRKLSLGLVSNRPRIEVEHLLKIGDSGPYFQAIVTLDEINEAGARPLPHPWALLEVARHLQPTPARSAYIGANPGDVHAARAANEIVPFTAIACLAGAHDKEAMRQEFEAAKANSILGHPNNLKELVE
jgi:phosphoglycolate phosphatase-like HAD superfamily hydrolase